MSGMFLLLIYVAAAAFWVWAITQHLIYVREISKQLGEIRNKIGKAQS